MGKGGKFIEAALKSLHARAGLTPLEGAFKADNYINALAGAGAADKTIRITIPRACRFVYDIASNRGGRHDPDEVDPNEIDANVVATNCSWILAEMIRHAQHAAKNLDAIKGLVAGLVRRRYPLIEDIGGRTYFHAPKASAVDVALVVLFSRYPNRLAVEQLLELVRHNGFTKKNADTAINRIRKYVDQDEEGQLVLRTTGLEKAEKIMAKADGQLSIRMGK